MSKKSQAKAAAKKDAGKIKYATITSMSDLEAAAGVTAVIVERMVLRNDKMTGVRLEGRRLKPYEVKEVKILLDAAMPPELPPLPPTKENPKPVPRYDFNHPQYLRALMENTRSARAYSLCHGFSCFGDDVVKKLGKPLDQISVQECRDYIENLPLEEDILESAYLELTKTVVAIDWERVVFSSGNNSQKS